VSLAEEKLLDDLRQRFFSPVTSRAPRTIGVELELIPVYALTRLPALPRSSAGTSTADVLSRLGKHGGWLEQSAEKDPFL